MHYYPSDEKEPKYCGIGECFIVLMLMDLIKNSF